MITEADVEAALEFLATTDEEAAKLKVAVETHDWLADRALATAFLMADNDLAIGIRNHIAKHDDAVQYQRNKWLDAIGDYHALENRRQTMKLKISLFQTLNRARSS